MKRGIIVLTLVLVVALIAGWMFVGSRSDVTLPLSVKFAAGETFEQVSAWKSEEGIYYIFLPAYANISEASFVLDRDVSVTIDGRIVDDGMCCDVYSIEEAYELSYQNWGKTIGAQIVFLQSQNIATMHIDTASGSMDYIHSKKGNAEDSTVRLYNKHGDALCTASSVEMKGRGNATWSEYDKKPYALQFQEAVDLLQLGAAENWILLANATDPTHMKNKLIFEFAENLGLAYSPDSQWVDLYLNNEYVGLYLLTERNEIHSERIAIEEDSWLVSQEFEERLILQNYPYVSTNEGICLRIHNPETITENQWKTIQTHWQSIENAIMAENNIDPITGRRLQDLIDINSWVRRYLVEEVFANGDACAISQFYYTLEQDGVTFAGPVWDEDYTLSPRGEWRLSYPNLLAAKLIEQRSIWFYYLYQNKLFYDCLISVYQDEVKPLLRVLMDVTADEYTREIMSASCMNQVRWNEMYGLEDELDRSLGYLVDRIQFLDQLWLDGTEMVSIQINSFGIYQGNILIPVGTSVGHELVSPAENEYQIFKGWYFADTGEPFDKERLIYEDVEVFAKWEEAPAKKNGQIMKILPVCMIAVMGAGLVLVEFNRWRKRRR